MAVTLEVESTLTDRYQTTVPETVRRALKLGKRDKLHYTIHSDGRVLIARAATVEKDDPALGQFLDFLATDISTHPERIRAIPQTLLTHIQSLVGQIEVDFDAPLSADDE